MKHKIAARMDQLTPSGIRKVNEKALAMERAGESVIHFELGRPDFDTPAYIKQACIESLEAGDVFYTSNFGIDALRQAIADKLLRENQVCYDRAEILVTVGLSEAVYDVLCSILDEGDEILIPNPGWLNYLNIPKLLGAVPVSYNLREENEFQIDIEELRSQITPKTKAIVIITPSNPTGGVLCEAVLHKLAEIAIEHDLLVISDEVYERLVFDDAKHISIASLPGMKERTFTMNGLSKAYSMTGWRIGYVAAPKEMIAVLNKIHQHNTTCAPSFVQKASIAALSQETGDIPRMVLEYKRRRDYAVNLINSIQGLHCSCPKGAFYIFINCGELGIPSQELAEYLLTHAKIALVPGDVFGEGGEGYLRMSFATSYENVVEGCGRLKESVKTLQAKHK